MTASSVSPAMVLSAPVNPEQEARVCIVAITRHGAAQAAQLARDLPEAHICTAAKFAQAFDGLPNPVRAYDGALRDEMAPLFAGYDQLVFFVSLGAVVRLIAPVLKSKDEDPGVTVVDDAGQFVIPVLSGHVGGANAMSERMASLARSMEWLSSTSPTENRNTVTAASANSPTTIAPTAATVIRAFMSGAWLVRMPTHPARAT